MLLRHSELTGSVYAVTRYKRDGENIVASVKHDVTADFYAIAGVLGYVRASPEGAALPGDKEQGT